MNAQFERLNAWHLQLAIVADSIEHLLIEIEEPEGLSATVHIVKLRLRELVDSCPFPDPDPVSDFDLDDFDGALPVDDAGVPAELLTGGRHD